MKAMERSATRRLLASALLPMLATCAMTPQDPEAPRVVTGVRIAPYERHEDCMALEDGDRLDFRFESQFPVAFNLQYRDGAVIVIPLSRERVEEFAGVFAAKATRPYCLAWEAGQQGAILDYRFRLRRPGS
jgi:hypothetical protein